MFPYSEQLTLLNLFQPFLFSQVSVDMVRRAEMANFKALVVTVDTVLLGRRLATERHELKYTTYLFLIDFEVSSSNF